MANIITCFRILCSIMLVFFPISSVQFFITYMLCGLTDVMDGIAGIKIGNVIYGFIYMERFMVEHTIMNKVTGILLFLLPLTVFLIEMKYSAMAVCSIATFSAIQEGYYIREGREYVEIINGKSITETAIEAGFSSSTHFAETSKRLFLINMR